MRRLMQMVQQRRKGSVLVIVIGVLALVSVLAIVYVSIGRGDTRTRAGVSKQNTLEKPPVFVRDYIAGVVADDVASFYWNQAKVLGANTTPSWTRESSDYGYVSPEVISISTRPATDPLRGAFTFNPIGSLPHDPAFLALTETQLPLPSRSTDLGAANPTRIRFGPSDPWLAATFPTSLNFDHTIPAGGFDELEPYPTDTDRDWLSITNIAPDGLFVNLYALRGNFNAQPGFTAGALSERLSLIDDGFDGFGDLNQNHTDTDFALDVSGNDERNRPFYWTMRQRNAFRSAAVSSNDALVSSPNFKLYQWADADGDGFLDSRWFELTDSSQGPQNFRRLFTTDDGYRWFVAARIIDANSMVNVNTAGDQRTAAARDAKLGVPSDVDLFTLLSGVHGFERFTTADVNGEQTDAPGGYDGLPERLTVVSGNVEDLPDYYAPQVPNGTTENVQAEIDGGADRVRSYSVAIRSYDALRLALAGGRVPELFDPANPATRFQGTVLDDNLAEFWGLEFGRRREKWDWANGDWDYENGNDDPPGVDVTWIPNQAVARRHAYYADFAKRYLDARASRDENGNRNPDQYAIYGRFGLESLLELNVYRTRNDYETLSPLEATFAARDISFATVGNVPGSVRFDPLRSNRPEADRVLGVDRVNNTNTAQLRPDGKADVEALHLARVDLRQLLTPISAARVLRGGTGVDPFTLAAGDFASGADLELRRHPDEFLAPLHKRLDSYSLGLAWVRPSGGNPAASPLIRTQRFEARKAAQTATEALFKAYTRVLDGSPRYRTEDAIEELRLAKWNQDEMRTAFYGWQGPEVALRAAAHLAINAADMRDMDRAYILGNVATAENRFELRNPKPKAIVAADDPHPEDIFLTETIAPTVAQFTLYNNEIGTLGQPGEPGDRDRFETEANILYPNNNDPNDPENDFAVRLDVPKDTARLIVQPGANPSLPGNITTDRLKLYGIEPQPFVTEVAVFTTYVDMPRADRGNDEGLDPADIDGPIAFGNADFMYRVLAFKLVNPFETTLNADYLKSCFVRFANDTYRLSPAESSITDSEFIIEPFGTRVFYVLLNAGNPSAGTGYYETVLARFPLTSLPAGVPELRRAVETTMGAGIDATPFMILPVDEATNLPVLPNLDFFDGARSDYVSLEVQLWREAPTSYYNGINPFTPASLSRNQLLDRMRLPAEGYDVLHEGTRLDGLVEISGTDNTDNDRPYSITLFGAFSRPSDPAIFTAYGSGAAEGVPDGAFPAYCFEPKDANSRPGGTTWNFPTPRNVERSPRSTLSQSDFNNNATTLSQGMCGGESVSEWKDNMKGSTPSEIVLHSLAINPKLPIVPEDFGGPTDLVAAKERSIVDPSRAPASTIVPGDPITTARNAATYAMLNRITLPPVRSDVAGDKATGPIIPSRPSDLLTPLAFGPAFNYHESAGLSPFDFYQQSSWRWATLGETAAAAMGYFQITSAPTLLDTDPTYVYLPRVDLATGRETYHLDRGHLRIDDYVPFYDRDNDQKFDTVADPNADPGTTEDELTLAESAPLAMRVFDYFHGFDRSIKLDMTRSAPGVVNISTAPLPVLSVLPCTAPPTNLAGRDEVQTLTLNNAVGSYTITFNGDQSIPITPAAGIGGLIAGMNSVPGLVNNFSVSGSGSGGDWTFQIQFQNALGQADINALSIQPSFSSGSATITDNVIRGRAGAGNSGWFEPALTGALSSKVDIASTMLSYRDKLPVNLRQPSYAFNIPKTAGSGEGGSTVDVFRISFDDAGLKQDVAGTPDDWTSWSARRTVSQITGLNEQPGFRSLAELIGIRVRELPTLQAGDGRYNAGDTYPFTRLGNEQWPRLFGLPTNIDFLGFDLNGGPGAAPPAPGENVGNARLASYPGLNDTYYQRPFENPPASGQFSLAHNTPQVRNSYEEQLLILNALGDSVSIRSDIYIAWFVLHGYNEQDCQMAPNSATPLVPSVARRFVMVIDRSKVVRKGDKPEILLFKEVPYAPFQ